MLGLGPGSTEKLASRAMRVELARLEGRRAQLARDRPDGEHKRARAREAARTSAPAANGCSGRARGTSGRAASVFGADGRWMEVCIGSLPASRRGSADSGEWRPSPTRGEPAPRRHRAAPRGDVQLTSDLRAGCARVRRLSSRTVFSRRTELGALAERADPRAHESPRRRGERRRSHHHQSDRSRSPASVAVFRRPRGLRERELRAGAVRSHPCPRGDCSLLPGTRVRMRPRRHVAVREYQ